MNRRAFLKTCGAGAMALMLCDCSSRNKSSSVVSQKPNIVVMVADDMGYGDAGCYGDSCLVPTPNVDRLAEGGVRFMDGYVTAPVCGPCRYGLLTGVYQQRFGVQWNWDCWAKLPGLDETPEHNRIPSHQKLMHETLKNAGYVTGIVGKYNLPCYPRTTFDETLSIMHFGGDYWPDESGHYDGVDEAQARGGQKDILWGPIREGDEYLTDRLGRQAVDFIQRHAAEPFFLYLAFNAPHSPMQAKTEHRRKVSHLPTEALRLYGAMLISMDENVGRVLDALEQYNVARNTIVVFLSDNGPTFSYQVDWPADWPKEVLGSAGPLRGFKGQYLEGGIRVPFLVRWPAQLKGGSVYHQPVSALDVYPTLCAAAGTRVSEGTHLDGVDLLPYLTGLKSEAPHKMLFWYSDDRGAVRCGKWKLYVNRDVVRLCDLDADIGETVNLAERYPEVTVHLTAELATFRSQMPPVLNPELYRKNQGGFNEEYRIFAEERGNSNDSVDSVADTVH